MEVGSLSKVDDEPLNVFVEQVFNRSVALQIFVLHEDREVDLQEWVFNNC